MSRSTKTVGILWLLPLILLPACEAFAQARLTDEEIRAVLQDRIDRAKQSVGIVIGLVDDKGMRVIAYGKPRQDSKQPLDGDSVEGVNNFV